MSTRIVENLLNRKISDLFDALDSDLDGMISANRIDIKNLEPKKLALLTPLLVEMEDLNLELDKENFTEAVKRLVKSLSISEKDYLLGVETKKKVRAYTGSMKDCTFRPKINPKSKEIAKKRTVLIKQDPNYLLNKVSLL